MPAREAPSVELGSAPETRSVGASPSPSESSTITSTNSSLEPQNIQAPPLFRVLAMPPPDPEQPPGQDELERRLPGYRRIIIPRELTLIELLKQYSGVTSDDEVLSIREAKLRVVAERVGLRRLHVLAPRLRSLTLDGSAIASLRDLGIGLVRLKFLSINRCNLTSLDGIWGLAALRELRATGNKLQDLQPLAVLQKLHTLDLANNPISESSRVWTLGVCGSLRKLSLVGTPASEVPDYRSRIASALPMLVYLDEQPLHNDDTEFDTNLFGAISSSSESDAEEAAGQRPPTEAEPGPSTLIDIPELPPDHGPEGDGQSSSYSSTLKLPRPATTECIGPRPARPRLPLRPHTAHGTRRLKPITRLEIMNTLLDEEWRCSGSSLTSRSAVCGNLAQALRRPAASSNQPRDSDLPETSKQERIVAATVSEAALSVAAEIPRAPRMEDWAKFKEDTGIEIEIDFNKRPKGCNPTEAIERLETIEKETKERLDREVYERKLDNPHNDSANEAKQTNSSSNAFVLDNRMGDVLSDFEMWRGIEDLAPNDDPFGDIDAIFNDTTTSAVQTIQRRRHFRRDMRGDQN